MKFILISLFAAILVGLFDWLCEWQFSKGEWLILYFILYIQFTKIEKEK